MFVVDTNVLLYAANSDAVEHAACREHLEKWRETDTPWYLTWGIAFEFLRVATHPRAFRKPLRLAEAWAYMNAVASAPNVNFLVATERHRAAADEVFNTMPEMSGNLLFDARIAILMREHGVKVIYTRDTDFNRFAFLEVVDPLTGSRRTSR